jgi:hypothetical protein
VYIIHENRARHQLLGYIYIFRLSLLYKQHTFIYDREKREN